MYVEGLATRATPQMGRFQRFSLHLAPPSGKMNTCALMPPPVLESVVSDIFELTPTVKTFRLRLPKGVDAGFKPGQALVQLRARFQPRVINQAVPDIPFQHTVKRRVRMVESSGPGFLRNHPGRKHKNPP